jgi:type II secretory pathway pseudopilin PulG
MTSHHVLFLPATDRNLIQMYVILAVIVVLAVVLLFLLDRALKAIEKGRRRREAGMRLYAAAAQAEAVAKQRKEKEKESKALTAVLPAILRSENKKPRKVA